MAAFIDDHQLAPVIDSVFPVAQIGDALLHLDRGGHFGKVVVVL